MTVEATNPKEAPGSAKPDMTLIPSPFLLELAKVMQHGADKYYPHSWRVEKVASRTYLAAAMRHIIAWSEGEEYDPDSGASHLAHAGACMAILFDAHNMGFVVDNRPPTTEAPREENEVGS